MFYLLRYSSVVGLQLLERTAFICFHLIQNVCNTRIPTWNSIVFRIMCVSVYAETCKTNHAVHTADIYCLLLFSIPNMTNSVCRRPTIRFRMKIYIFEMEYTIYGLRSDPHHHKDRNNIARWREHRTRGIFILCGQFYLFSRPLANLPFSFLSFPFLSLSSLPLSSTFPFSRLLALPFSQ